MNDINDFHGYLGLIGKFGSKPAVCDAISGRSLSYADLCERSYDIASRLDIGIGERVILYGLHPVDWTVVFLAIALKGGIAVPVDERVGNDFFREIVKLTVPKLIIAGKDVFADAVAKILTFDDISNLEKKPFESGDFTDCPCEIIFTSGTWADPKGVTLSQRNILSNTRQLLAAYHEKRTDVFLGILPLSHSYQQVFGLFAPLARGAQVVFLSEINSIDMKNAIRDYQVAAIPLVPGVLSMLRNAIVREIRYPRLRDLFIRLVPSFRHLPLFVRRMLFADIHRSIGTSLRYLISGGAPLDAELDCFFQGIGYVVYVGYGLSECSPVVSACLRQRRTVGEVGPPLPGVDVSVGKDGEIIVKGENVCMGYWPDVSGMGTCGTGDLGYVARNGSIILNGRSKNLIIFNNGQKIFCEDIERIVIGNNAVKDCCAIGIEHEDGQTVECIVCTEDDVDIDVGKVLRESNAKMPFGMRIWAVHRVNRNDFFYTHTMKIDRKNVRKLLYARQRDSDTDATGHSDHQDEIA